jgi:hypothetical protein
MSIFVSVPGLKVERNCHTVELEPLTTVEEATVTEADLLESLDLLNLMLLAELKIDSGV